MNLKYFAVRILYLNLYKHHQFAADIPPNSRMTYPKALQGMGTLGPLGPDRPRVWIKHKKIVCKIVCTRFGMEIFSPFLNFGEKVLVTNLKCAAFFLRNAVPYSYRWLIKPRKILFCNLEIFNFLAGTRL